jgi:hypothetical protein
MGDNLYIERAIKRGLLPYWLDLMLAFQSSLMFMTF